MEFKLSRLNALCKRNEPVANTANPADDLSQKKKHQSQMQREDSPHLNSIFLHERASHLTSVLTKRSPPSRTRRKKPVALAQAKSKNSLKDPRNSFGTS